MADDHRYSTGELTSELRRFEAALKAANLRPNTVATYVTRSEYFIKWLAGDYKPSGPR